MKIDIETFDSGWHGLAWGMSRKEAGLFIERLQVLIDDPTQHFHLSGTFEGKPGIGDVEVFIDESCESGDIQLSSLAICPND
jgi:hypothetical protein